MPGARVRPRGRGATRDYVRAYAWYTRTAEGPGVTRDYVRAYAWHTRTAEGPGLDPDRAALNQVRLAAKMTPEERAAARRRLAEWGP